MMFFVFGQSLPRGYWTRSSLPGNDPVSIDNRLSAKFKSSRTRSSVPAGLAVPTAILALRLPISCRRSSSTVRRISFAYLCRRR
jgi:hypothetical protein